MSLDQRVPADSFVYGEVVRLYRIAQSLRPTTIDRWTGDLYATRADTWGGLHPKTGVFKLSADRVLPYLTGAVSPTERRRQAQALATVLHEATHGAMLLDAPTEPNAVRTMHSYGLTEGFAEVRAFADFELFVRRAGYTGLTLGDPQYPGAYAAARDLMAHITGPSCPQNALIDKVCQGPGVMHFDQFAHAVVVNQLHELTHRDQLTQQAVRAQLIEPMLHNYWPTLPGASAATGQMVAREIRSDLDTKVDELRRQYRLTVPRQVSGPIPHSERRPASSAARQDTLEGLRFLASQPSPAGAITHRPQLDQGTRHATPTGNPRTRPGHSPLRD